jgi:hypothetical protein
LILNKIPNERIEKEDEYCDLPEIGEVAEGMVD